MTKNQETQRQDPKPGKSLFVVCSRIGTGPVRVYVQPVPTEVANDMLANAASLDFFWPFVCP